MEKIIDSPFSNGKAILKKKKAAVIFKGQKFKIKEHYYLCVETGEEFTTAELDEINVNQVYGKSI